MLRNHNIEKTDSNIAQYPGPSSMFFPQTTLQYDKISQLLFVSLLDITQSILAKMKIG